MLHALGIFEAEGFTKQLSLRIHSPIDHRYCSSCISQRRLDGLLNGHDSAAAMVSFCGSRPCFEGSCSLDRHLDKGHLGKECIAAIQEATSAGLILSEEISNREPD